MTSEHIKAEYAQILEQTEQEYKQQLTVIKAITTAVNELKEAGLPVSTTFDRPMVQSEIQGKAWRGGLIINETRFDVLVRETHFCIGSHGRDLTDTQEIKPFLLHLTAAIQVEETAKNKRMAPPKETSKTEWKKLSASEVARISDHPAIDRRLTDIFNFETREHTHINQNLTTDAESTSLREFDTLRDKTLLQQALDAFTKAGGKADPRVIETHFINRKMEPLFRTAKADKPATP